MRGAPARAIQELAGHRDLAMTLRYMHLSGGDRRSDPAVRSDRDGRNFWRHWEDGA